MKFDCAVTSARSPQIIRDVFTMNNQRFRNVYITMGLPGTGKTSFCERLYSGFPPGQCKLIKRDQVRMDLLWDIRKEDPKKQEEQLKNIDNLTTEAVIEAFYAAYDNSNYAGFIIDGCHTEARTMLALLNAIRGVVQDEPVVVTVCIVGCPYSGSYYQLTDQSEGDYSGFERDGKHTSIPLIVYNKKKRQMLEFLNDTDAFETMSYLADSYLIVPSFDGRFVEIGAQ